jgi:hypothetical protein
MPDAVPLNANMRLGSGGAAGVETQVSQEDGRLETQKRRRRVSRWSERFNSKLYIVTLSCTERTI